MPCAKQSRLLPIRIQRRYWVSILATLARRCWLGSSTAAVPWSARFMIVMDSRAIAHGATKLMTPKLQRALMEFAATRSPRAQPRGVPPPRRRARCRRAFSQAAAARQAPVPAPRVPPPPTLQPVKSSPALQRAQKGVSPEIDRLHAALRKSPIALYVQRLMPLAKGSALKRYECCCVPNRTTPQRGAAGNAGSGGRQWPGLHDRSARHHRADRIPRSSSRYLEEQRGQCSR